MSDLNYSINVLSSCPCCGSTDVSFRFKAIEDKTMHSISCFGCSLQIGYFITREAAARVWNRRPEPPRVDVGEALDFLVSMAKDQLEHPQHGNTERAAAVIRAALKQPAQAQGVDLFEKCPRCNGDGSYGVPDKYGEPIPQQCEHCFAIGYVPHIATQTTQEE